MDIWYGIVGMVFSVLFPMTLFILVWWILRVLSGALPERKERKDSGLKRFLDRLGE